MFSYCGEYGNCKREFWVVYTIEKKCVPNKKIMGKKYEYDKNIVIALKLNLSAIIINWRQFADSFQTDWGKKNQKKKSKKIIKTLTHTGT